jgi:hypothetical protein
VGQLRCHVGSRQKWAPDGPGLEPWAALHLAGVRYQSVKWVQGLALSEAYWTRSRDETDASMCDVSCEGQLSEVTLGLF